MNKKYLISLLTLLVILGFYQLGSAKIGAITFGKQEIKKDIAKLEQEELSNMTEEIFSKKSVPIEVQNDRNPYLNQNIGELKIIRSEYQDELEKSQLISMANENRLSMEEMIRLENLFRTLNQINIAILKEELKEI